MQKPSKDLTLIVYNTPHPPRYLKVNKQLIRFLMFAIPILLTLSLLFSFASSIYMKSKLETARSQEPEIILGLRNDKAALQEQVSSLQTDVANLTEKISLGVGTTASSSLGLFSIPLGYKDITDSDMVKLENMSVNFKQNKIEFRFDLLNNLETDERLAGFIHIIQQSGGEMQFYPDQQFTTEKNRLEFAKGENFVVSRFRPVIAEFSKPQSLNVWYKIFIFNRSGDLINYKIAGPYQVN